MTDSMIPAQAWSAVAEAWDANADYVDEHSVEATAAVLDRVAVQLGDRVLELAAGPGSLGATWAQLVGPAGTVVVSDIAPRMVEVARRRNAALGNVETAVIDLAAIDRPDESFDAVACRMGLMFTADPSVAFAEMLRVLRPDGRLGALTWGGIEHNPWMTCVGMAAMANGLVSGGPPVGPGGIFSLGDPGSRSYLLNLIENASIPYELTHPGAHCVAEQALVCRSGPNPPGYAPTWATPFLSMFMHGGLLHLGGNMLFLWIFGNNVEDAMGRVRFVLFYVLGGLAATLLQVIVGPGSQVPNIGASGAIAAVLGGYLLLFPRARVVTVVFIIFFFTIVELPAIFFLGVWIVEQALFGYFDLNQPGRGGGGGVAYFAHIGGFAFGLLAVKLFADERKRREQLLAGGRV